MKKVFLIAAIAVSTTASAQIGFGAQIGGNLANVKWEEDNGSGGKDKAKTDSKFGFLIGAVANVPIASSLSFRPELNFIQKGAKMDLADVQDLGGGASSTTTGKTEITMNFIELPLNIVYSADAGAGKVYFGAGPSIGFGMSGKYKSSGTNTTVIPGFPTQTTPFDNSADIKFDGKKDATDANVHLKGLDFGANILAGYRMSNNIFIQLGYAMGFSNLSPETGSSFKTNGLTLKLGYMFGGSSSSSDDK